jgi:hypothetical protein
METFQKIVLYTAIIMLIIMLVFIGIYFGNAQQEQWPPLVPECPDYWISDGSGNNQQCINIKDLGVCPPKSGDRHLKMNFNSDLFAGSNGTCAKYNWANTCKVTWDGLTYGVEKPTC